MPIRKLSETSIYKYLDSSKGLNFAKSIEKFMSDTNTVQLSKYDIEDTLLRMQSRSFGHPTKPLIDKIGSEITLLFNASDKLITAIPFFTRTIPGGGKNLVINLSNYCSRNKDGSISGLSPHLLYTLMLGGWYSLILDTNIR